MKLRGLLLNGAVATALVTAPLAAVGQTVQDCPNAANCAEVIVGSDTGGVNQTVTIPVTFKQAPGNAQAGGPDEIAALALTLNIPGTGGAAPLVLADCTLDADGLPAAINPNAAISNFKVVVENASCTNGRTHCLCPQPGGGIQPDDFINIVVYGPNPLPTPGPNPIEIPVLPVGPQELFSIDLRIAAGANGEIPLRALNQVDDAVRPQFRAFLSVGDKEAVDQTCVPIPGSPPCSAAGSVSQVAITHGSVTVEGMPCVGDCSGEMQVTVDELLTMVNIALGSIQVIECPPGDSNGDGQITVDEILTAVTNALNGCPN